MVVVVIEREFVKVAGFALAGALLAFFALMHNVAVGLTVSAAIAAAYALVVVGLFAVGRASLPVAAAAKAAGVH